MSAPPGVGGADQIVNKGRDSDKGARPLSMEDIEQKSKAKAFARRFRF